MINANAKTKNSEVLKNAGIAIVIATTVNVILFYTGRTIDAFDTEVINPGTNSELVVTDVVQASISFLIIGIIVYFIVDKIGNDTRSNFRNLAGVAALLSLSMPLQITGLEVLTYLFLALMHISSAIIFIYFLVYKE